MFQPDGHGASAGLCQVIVAQNGISNNSNDNNPLSTNNMQIESSTSNRDDSMKVNVWQNHRAND